MKAIVIIDEFPKSCYECPLAHSETGFFGDICDSVCTVLDRTNIVFMDGIGKPDWCPLKPIVKKKTPHGSDVFNDYVNGWNDCVDAIGETE